MGQVSKTNPLMKKEYYLNRIVKASGVPKKQVRLVIGALPTVVFNIMADCGRVQIFDGVIMEGVMKEDDKRSYYDINTGEIKDCATFIRPRCVFGEAVKKIIKDIYDEKQEINAQKKGKKKR